MKQQEEISKFTECVEKNTTQLENAYTSDNIPAETAAKMVVSAGATSILVLSMPLSIRILHGDRDRVNEFVIKLGRKKKYKARSNYLGALRYRLRSKVDN